MGAENPIRRKRTARETAEQFGVNPRTIRKLIAEPREDFLARAAANRARAVELRSQCLLYREIADEMGITIGTVGKLLHDARRIQLQAQADEQKRA